jgi:hypothetical protein
MATYKVIQDIEAEDKLVGPLSFRQFVYALIAALFFYLSFVVVTKGAPVLLVAFLPPGLVCGFFAFPFGQDQPTEVWALAKIRFLFKPRKRIWDQSGLKELVTVTAPKKVEEVRTDGLSQTEVRSRLSALANTIDSRGWAVKNVNLNIATQAAPIMAEDSDRLIDVSGLPQDVPATDIQAADDILDEQNNPIAHQFDQMINASTHAHRQQLMQMMQHQQPAQVPAPMSAPSTSSTPADYWFLSQPVPPPNPAPNQAMFTTSAVLPGTDTAQPGVVQAAEPTPEEEAIAEHAKAEHARPDSTYAHLKTIQPLGMQAPAAQQASDDVKTTAAAPVTPPRNPAILELASNNDLNVATLARQAHKKPELPDEGEVVIALH